MADISFADVKVHNEVEFCTITDLNVKKQLERLFLDERISYYEKWDDVSFFKRVFAGGEEIMEAHPDLKAGIEMINKKVERTFF